jgi:hypothetical protein
MPLSDAWSDNLTRLLLGLSTAPAPPSPLLAIYTVLPAPDGTGGTQIDTAGYGFGDPVDVSGDSFWSEPADGEGLAELLVDVNMGTPTSDPGPVVGVALIDMLGALITEAVEFDDPIDVVVGTPFVVPASAVTFQSL